MSILQAILLGVIEGVTEFLPISSTAHMIIFSKLFQISQTDFLKSFEIIIQFGAIIAIIFVYFKSIIKIKFEDFKKIIFAFLPTAIFGVVMYKIVKEFLMENNLIMVLSLFIGGIGLILIEKYKIGVNRNVPVQNDADKSNLIDFSSISYKKSFLIGVFQSIAMIPGVSRSAATIMGGMFIGIERKIIVDFSFLLAIPTMAAATALDVFKNYKTILHSGNFNLLIIGFIVSFIVAYVVSKWFLKFIKKNNFVSFGIYRIIISIILFILFFVL